MLPGAASAHAYLIDSDPPAGGRLSSSPKALVMRFSEAYVPGSAHVSMRRVDEAPIVLPRPSGSGAVIDQPLPPGLHGVFVVSWTLVSNDGHLCAGDFAFSVGASGAIPPSSASSAATPWSQVVASWLFFVGLAFAFGGLLSELLVWPRSAVRAPVVPGLVVSAFASASLVVLLAGERVSGGFVDGLHGHAIREVASSRPGSLTIAVLGSVLLALLLAPRSRWRRLALAPLAAAAVLTAARGHAGTSGDWWAPVADSVHLLAAAAWVGALAHLVVVLARDRDTRRTDAIPVRRYSRLALPTVLVVLASGALTALAEFRSVGSVLDTGYGRTLVVKALLVLAALGAAAASRFFALPANPGIEIPLLRRLTFGELGLVVAVLAAAGLLVNLAPPRGPAEVAAATSPLGPPALVGPALRQAGFAGTVAVGLAATRDELRFLVMPPHGRSAARFKLNVEATAPDGKTAALFPRPCGSGCFSVHYALQRGTTHLMTTVSPPDAAASAVRLDIRAPIPAERPALLGRMAKAIRAAPYVNVVERLGPGAGLPSATTQYHLTGGAFAASDKAAGPIDVRVVGLRHGLTKLTFASADATTWYEDWLDAGNKLRRERIVSQGRSIERTLSYPKRAQVGTVVAPGPVRRASIPTGPFVVAREDGDLAVAFAAAPEPRGRLSLTTTVLDPDGDAATGLDVRVSLRSRRSANGSTQLCGAGCYAVSLPYTDRPREALIEIRRLGYPPSVVRFDFPSVWPPPPATRLARHATRVFSGLKSLTIDEHLGSSATNVLHTLWQIQAPDRLSYTIDGGSAAIVVGKHRWDREAGGEWIASPQLPLQQPTPTWGAAPRRAALLGSESVRGRAVWRISFVDPSVPAWYTILVDKQSGRTLELWMTAAAHFMHHVYAGFDRPLSITAP